MEYYEKIIYEHQTQARGLLDENSLLKVFNKTIPYFDYHLLQYLPKNKDAVITEIPCGFGKFLYFLKQKGYEDFVGYDFDKKQIDLALKLNLPAKTGNAFMIIEKLPPQDAIITIDFLEHLEKNDAIVFLEKCFSKLKKNGVLIIKIPSADGFFGMSHLGNDFTHKWALTEIAWKKSLLPAVGFNTNQIIVKDERIPPKNIFKKMVFKLSNLIFHIFLKSMALGAPNILSRSMWVIAKK